MRLEPTCRDYDWKSLQAVKFKVFLGRKSNVKCVNSRLDPEIPLSCIDTVDKLISTLKKKLSDDDLKKSLNELFGKESTKRYLVDFYILFQIMERLEKGRLETMVFDELKSKMVLIREKIQHPDDLVEHETHQHYFESMLCDVSV